MGLIPSSRHTTADLRHWETMAGFDRRLSVSPRLSALGDRAIRDVADFADDGPCYVSVSWGKDSVVVASLVALAGLALPVVWIRVEPNENPDCYAVRDAFLARFPHVDYHELTVPSQWDVATQSWDGGMLGGKRFAPAKKAFGQRYVSGIRSEENKARDIRQCVWGVSSPNTCAPITRWTAVEVFAWLSLHDLPIHPAYACSHGGALDRRWLRVAYLGGGRGRGAGREEWERAYYREEMDQLDTLATAQTKAQTTIDTPTKKTC